jgi:hypothetical protein
LPAADIEGSIIELTLRIGGPLLSDKVPAVMSGWNTVPFDGNLVTVARSDEQGGFVCVAGHRVIALNPLYWSIVKFPGTTLSLMKFFIKFAEFVLKNPTPVIKTSTASSWLGVPVGGSVAAAARGTKTLTLTEG